MLTPEQTPDRPAGLTDRNWPCKSELPVFVTMNKNVIV